MAVDRADPASEVMADVESLWQGSIASAGEDDGRLKKDDGVEAKKK